MKKMKDSVWQRRGISWIWDAEALRTIAKPNEVVSLREWLLMPVRWAGTLPSNGGNTLVVAGLEGCLDLLAPGDAKAWLGHAVKKTILSFQDLYDSDAALAFWLPEGKRRLNIHSATDAVIWQCAAPHGGSKLDFGRVLWGEAREYPQELILRDGAQAAGLFHLRIT
jgi:hypothetical protein